MAEKRGESVAAGHGARLQATSEAGLEARSRWDGMQAIPQGLGHGELLGKGRRDRDRHSVEDGAHGLVDALRIGRSGGVADDHLYSG